MKQPIKLSDQVFLLTASTLLAQILQLFANAATVRLMSKDELGLYRQVLLATSIITPFFVLGITNSIYYFISKLENKQKLVFLIQTWGLQLIGGSSVAIIMYWAATPVAIVTGEPNIAPYLQIFFLFPIFNFVLATCRQVLLSIEMPIWAACFGIINVLGHPVLVVVLLTLDLDLKQILIWLTISVLIRFVIFITLCIQRFNINKGNNRKGTDTTIVWNSSLLQEQLKFSMPLAVSDIAAQLTAISDKWIVSLLFSASKFASYSVGAFQLPLVGAIATPILDAVLPRMSSYWHQGKVENFINLWHESMHKAALLLFPITVFFLVLAHPTFLLLFSEKYTESVIIFQILLLLVPNQITMFSSVLTTMGATKIVSFYFIVNLFLQTLLSYAFGRLFGWIGPAVSIVLVAYLHNFIQIVWIQRLTNKTFYNVMPWSFLLKVMLAAFIPGLLTYPVILLGFSLGSTLILGAINYAVLYLVIGFNLNIFKRSDVMFVYNKITRIWYHFKAY